MWERYKGKIRYRCTTTADTFKNIVATEKDPVKRKLIKNLAMYVLKKLVDSVTDANIMDFVQTCCRILKTKLSGIARLVPSIREDGLLG
ncbi:hypothetical protein PF008_g1257 [Phytophthora fragariae]|uniref:Uncharacterized protein n=1 Tax=Phytophthora fragariae TaxID=53985 RepID=A0A6G0SKK6_9STRA|nr:hypothetical protein PF008_g1257 [Phytophthora fragariae]